ncbi:CoA-transferase family III domain-containing protein [Halenospora varia]|nr:CoA-transferase family III domain-containing protein [Halenospora varia]
MGSTLHYSVPLESERLLKNSILLNVLHKDLPDEAVEYGSLVRFEGSNNPSIPINWRFAESVASLKGFEAVMINVLLKRKYGVDPGEVVINTDHAQLFFMSALLVQINPEADSPVEPTPVRELTEKYAWAFPKQDLHNMASSAYRRAATNIYKTRDGQYLHLHGGLNPGPSIIALGMPVDKPEIQDVAESYKGYMDKIATYDALELENIINEQHKQACTIARKPGEYQESAHGKANSQTGLYEVTRTENRIQGPCWWPDSPETSKHRPLAGLKIVDLTRVIAGPSVVRGMAELGASVMRVTAPHISDFTGLHPDLNWGKWNCSLDLRQDADREKLRALIMDADVVVDGYRPRVFEKYGFGRNNVLEMCKTRERGIIYARENCYGSPSSKASGWNGPWQHRSGWQPISDANCGVSYEFGRAMGNDEPVTPVFPNSDYCTGIAGVCGIVQALLSRGSLGGSYTVDISLNYYSQWLVNSCGTYPSAVWEDVWTRNGRESFRHYQSMNVTLPRYLKMIKENSSDVLLQPEFFEVRESKVLGLKLRVVKPILRFTQNEVKLGYNVGTRGNGADAAKWPEDLLTEVVR